MCFILVEELSAVIGGVTLSALISRMCTTTSDMVGTDQDLITHLQSRTGGIFIWKSYQAHSQ
jgi:hypothetical protein